MDDMEEMTLKANQLTDESLESTRRMRHMAEETQETGVKTLGMLDDQGNKLNDIETGLDKINEDMKVAEKNLTEMSKCCGLCLCPCNRVKTTDRGYRRAPDSDSSKGAVVSSQPTSSRNGQPGPESSGPYIKRITNDAREDEMEENLGYVGDIVGNLKNMALDMGTELDKQNKQIDRINEKAEVTNARVQDADKRANNLLK
ncbi:synaptosomal-associated protein 23-like [Paramormyrops kingsleyae]|uniref:Synaptosomal-associated protein n=1 Tax=Paramormyrops kingsleyae TaxID=1676925 RepID=A0A3B3QIS0_9TELE|nr:synaptosomal-associated protein 23-like [Paramormyrops kingsleyae]XP_023698935.1 synaptosomal-associated protein 23-like [Paramormyrops kingsleyae]